MADRQQLAQWIREQNSTVFREISPEGAKLYIKIPAADGLVYIGYQWWSESVSAKDITFYAFFDPRSGNVMTDDPDFPNAWDGRTQCAALISQHLQKIVLEAQSGSALSAHQHREAAQTALKAFCIGKVASIDTWLEIRCARLVSDGLGEAKNAAQAMRDLGGYADRQAQYLASVHHECIESLGAVYHEAVRLYSEAVRNPDHPWWAAWEIYTAAVNSAASVLSVTNRDGITQQVRTRDLQFQVTELSDYEGIRQIKDDGRVIYRAA